MTPLRAALHRGACVLAIVPACTASAADWTLECPARLATAQSVAGSVPAGWTVYDRTTSAMKGTSGVAATARAVPLSISVYDGPPSEMADLVPDDPNAKVQRWTLPKARTRDTYIVCNYMDTRIRLARKVPAEATSCAARTRDDAAIGIVCR